MLSPNKIIAGRSAADWISSCPVVGDICELKETAWLNPDKQPFEQAKAACPLGMADIEDAAARLERFAPYLCRVFPETAESHGIIESARPPHPRDAEGAGRNFGHRHRRAGVDKAGQSSADLRLHQGPRRHL